VNRVQPHGPGVPPYGRRVDLGFNSASRQLADPFSELYHISYNSEIKYRRSRQGLPLLLEITARAGDQNARYWCTDRTDADPSPTAAATRLVDPDRRSPTANRPGWLVSKGSGDRASVCQL
jgi:hypothetical protein